MKKTWIKGITLVALIIAIVVLLILAVILINSMINNEIMGKTESSTEGFEGAQEDKQGIGDLEYGVKLSKEDLEELELMKRYVMGSTGEGRESSEIVNLKTYVFIDEEETIPKASTEITTLNIGWNENLTRLIAYCRYNDRAYKIVLKGNNTTNVLNNTTYTTEGVELIYKPEGREGTTVAYDSNGDGSTEEWVIITDRNGKVEIVSKDVSKDAEGNVLTLQLGGTDPEIKANLLTYLDLNKDGIPDDLDGDGTIEEGGTDLDGDGITEVDYQDIAIASYNNAITTINNYCKSLVTTTTNVRSVGGTNNDWTPYSSTNYDNWGKNISTDVASGDMQYELDLVKLSYYGIAYTTNHYFLASRVIGEYSSHVYFRVNFVNDGMLSYYSFLWCVDDVGYIGNYYPSYGVRPVVINPRL